MNQSSESAAGSFDPKKVPPPGEIQPGLQPVPEVDRIKRVPPEVNDGALGHLDEEGNWIEKNPDPKKKGPTYH